MMLSTRITYRRIFNTMTQFVVMFVGANIFYVDKINKYLNLGIVMMQ